MSNYPNTLDTDIELPKVEESATEISSDAVNSIRDSVIAVQKTIGTNPQGNKSSFNERINVSIDANGLIKRTALENLGILTLPVVDRHIGNNAGIQEAKLSLEYSTRSLKTMIDSLRTDLSGSQGGLSNLISSFNNHILGTAHNHDGYMIKINSGEAFGVVGLNATTIGAAINEICDILYTGNGTKNAHIENQLSGDIRHTAASISVDASGFELIDATSETVQDALNSLDSGSGALSTIHVDTFHSNGVLKEIKSGFSYDSVKLFGPLTISCVAGSSVVTITGITSFADYGLKVGDYIEISETLESGAYQVLNIGPIIASETLGNLPELLANQLSLFKVFKNTATGTVNAYASSSDSSKYCPLACAIKNNDSICDTISILNPNAARVVSIGFNSGVFYDEDYSLKIRVGVGGGQYRAITIPNLERERLEVSKPTVIDAGSIAERINAYVSEPDSERHFPITAYKIGNELAIAHNWVGAEYSIKIIKENGDGLENSYYGLGFDEYGANILNKEIFGKIGNYYTINGKNSDVLKVIFEGTASITTSSDTFVLLDSNNSAINPISYGIKSGSVLHISGHPTLNTNGSYTVSSSTSSTVSIFTSEIIDAPQNPTIFNVKVFSSEIPTNDLLGSDENKGILQVFINSDGETILRQRISYENSGSGLEIVNITPGFPSGECLLSISTNSGNIIFNLIYETVSGPTVTVSEDFIGSFKLYHSNGIDYLLINKIGGSGTIIDNPNLTIKILPVVPSDELLLIATIHFDGVKELTNCIDSRLFGTLGTDQIRNDFTELFVQRPNAELHGDGIVRGFDLLNVVQEDDIVGLPAIPLSGGVAYVNGVRVEIESQKVIIQPSSGIIKKILGINEFGTLQFFEDTVEEILLDGSYSSEIYGKILPLFVVITEDGSIVKITDIRKFINNISHKLELIVDGSENNNVGNFKTIEGALYYANKYPNKEKLTIKIINPVYPTEELFIPSGVSLIGSSLFGGEKQQIINETLSNTDFITLAGNNKIKNIEIISDSASLNTKLLNINGSNVSIFECILRYGDTEHNETDNNIAIYVDSAATEFISIKNNKILNVYSGIVSKYGADNLSICENKIENVCGIVDTNDISCGILIENSTRAVSDIKIFDNKITFPSTNDTDLRGICVNISSNNDISNLSIRDNKIFGASGNKISNGIRIDKTNESYTGKIKSLIINHNLIDKIKLNDDNVFGIYVRNINDAIINENFIYNSGIYDSTRTVSAIYASNPLNSIQVSKNIIKDCDLTQAIYINSEEGKCIISENIIEKAGIDAEYIRGKTVNSIISENLLVGSASKGVYWTGENSKICKNNLCTFVDGYSFGEFGILVGANDIDIEENTLTHFKQDGSVVISNLNPSVSYNRIKILGNTVSGEHISNIIEIKGSNHLISNNKLYNATNLVAGTNGILLIDSVSDSLIQGNIFSGELEYGITESGTSPVISGLTILNNKVIATLSEKSAYLPSAEECLVANNHFPDATIGQSPTITSGPIYNKNENTFGINKGMSDTLSISASSGYSDTYSIVDDVVSGKTIQYANWLLTDGYWYINKIDGITPSSRTLYFPISFVPNGVKLSNIKIQGRFNANSGSLDCSLNKQNIKSYFDFSTIGNMTSITSDVDDFGNETTTGNISVNSNEIVNHEINNYFVKISTTAAPTNADDIRIYGITITFIY